jgi:hypothetical protein
VRKIIVPFSVVNQIPSEPLCKSVDGCAKFPRILLSSARLSLGAATLSLRGGSRVRELPSAIFEVEFLNFICRFLERGSHL